MGKRTKQRPPWLRPFWISILAVAAGICLIAAGAGLVLDDKPKPKPKPALGPVPALGSNADKPAQLAQTLEDMGRRSIQWNTSYMHERDQLDTKQLDAEAKSGARYHIVTLEIGLVTKLTLQQISNGGADKHLYRIARQMKDWQQAHPGHTIIARPLHEANGDWYSWGFKNGHNGNTPETFKTTWRRVHARMTLVFPGLKFFWCANKLDVKEVSYTAWFPGERTVDYVGADVYNFSSDGWRPPGELYTRTIKAIRAVAPHKPLIIGETGTNDALRRTQAQSKATWFRQFGDWLQGDARKYGIVAVMYFNYDKRKEPFLRGDWRIFPTRTDDLAGIAETDRAAFRNATRGIP